MKRLTFTSHAKVNLYLAVIGTLPRGYHELVTVFERISLSDTITVSARGDGRVRVHCDDVQVPCDASNLCHASAVLLKRACGARGRLLGADIVIEKNIPVGAGLGGGSSNAAAALTGLNRLWKCGFSRAALVSLAARIGSDTAFFVYDTPFALGTNRGEIITPLKAPRGLRLIHVIVVPRVHVATARIYTAWDRKCARGLRASRSGLTKKCADDRLLARNDLEPLTSALYPEVGRVHIAMRKAGLSHVMMSGSGPSVSGLAPTIAGARRCRAQLLERHPDWRVFCAATV